MAKKPRKRIERPNPVRVDEIDFAPILAAAKSLLAAEDAAAVRRGSDPGTAAHSLIRPRRALEQALGELPADGWLSDADEASRAPIAMRQLAEVVREPDNLASTMKLRAAIANLRGEEIAPQSHLPCPGGEPGFLHLVVDSDNHSVSRDNLGRIEFASKEKPWAVFRYLYEAKGSHRKLRQIEDAVWDDDPHTENAVVQAVSRANKLLRPLGVEIKSEAGPRYYLGEI